MGPLLFENPATRSQGKPQDAVTRGHWEIPHIGVKVCLSVVEYLGIWNVEPGTPPYHNI
jgi:hypothetical protein